MRHAWRQFGLGVGAILLVLTAGLLIRFAAADLPVGPDVAWQELMASHRVAPGVAVAQAMAWIGKSPGTWFVSAGAMAVALILRQWRTAIALLLAVEIGVTCSSAIKLLSARPRPTGAVELVGSFAFPSGHTTWAAAVAASLALALPRVWSWALAGAWIALMAWSRTYLGVHWLSDVAAGAVLGIGIALLAAGVVELLAPSGRHCLVHPFSPETVEERA